MQPDDIGTIPFPQAVTIGVYDYAVVLRPAQTGDGFHRKSPVQLAVVVEAVPFCPAYSKALVAGSYPKVAGNVPHCYG